eukprot:Colp12_sorted_trinity150504_noHs@11271
MVISQEPVTVLSNESAVYIKNTFSEYEQQQQQQPRPSLMERRKVYYPPIDTWSINVLKQKNEEIQGLQTQVDNLMTENVSLKAAKEQETRQLRMENESLQKQVAMLAAQKSQVNKPINNTVNNAPASAFVNNAPVMSLGPVSAPAPTGNMSVRDFRVELAKLRMSKDNEISQLKSTIGNMERDHAAVTAKKDEELRSLQAELAALREKLAAQALA